MTATQPYERQPMWYRANGGLIVTTADPHERVEDQDWSSLVLDIFVGDSAISTERTVVDRGTGSQTKLAWTMQNDGRLNLQIHASDSGLSRSWVLRFHLRPGQQVGRALVDGVSSPATHLAPLHQNLVTDYFPFGGPGTAPAPHAGHVAEMSLESASHMRIVECELAADTPLVVI